MCDTRHHFNPFVMGSARKGHLYGAIVMVVLIGTKESAGGLGCGAETLDTFSQLDARCDVDRLTVIVHR